MLDADLFASIASQLMTGSAVQIEGKRFPVQHTSTQRLRTVSFAVSGHEYQAIEQSPEKPSRWGQLAKSGHQVVQFKDTETNRFIAVAVDGKVKEYGSLKKR